MNRRYPDRPFVGVGAIIFRGDQVLLIRRGTPPALGKWSIPGGLVEVGESLEDAVRREILEEVGLDVKVLDLVAVLDRVIRDQEGRIEYHYILIDFLCESTRGDPQPATDADECAFVSLDRLSAYNLTRGTEKIIRRAFERSKEKPVQVYDPML